MNQTHWVDAALDMFGRVFGGATAYPKAKGIWRDDDRGGALVKDEPVVIHCYTTPADVQNSLKLAELASFCSRPLTLVVDVRSVCDGAISPFGRK